MIGYFSDPTAIRRAIDRQERKEAMKKIREERAKAHRLTNNNPRG